MTGIFKPGMVINDQVELLKYREKGGQAEIWEVRNLTFTAHANLALKLHYTDWENRSDHDFQQRQIRLQAEIDLLGACKSAYIIAPHFLVGGKETSDGQDYALAGVVMDLASEGSLYSFYQSEKFKQLSAPERFYFMEHMARGLHAVQHYEIIHNDIKPANILVNNEAGHYRPRYADFGYAFKRGGPIVRAGTPGYMAPEIHLKTGDPSFESDIYSLGISFYEMLLGHHPLDQLLRNSDQMKALQGYYYTHEYIDSAPLRELDSPEMAKLIQRMCSRNPANRPTIEEVIEELEGLAREVKSRFTPRAEEAFPELAGRFRWSETVHAAFGESERIIFLKGARAELDPQYLSQRLAKERLFGYSIFRLLGASDYMLRIWRTDADQEGLDAVLRDYRAERGAYEVFTPLIRRPEISRTAAARLSSQAAVVTHLLQMAEADLSGPQLRTYRVAGLIAGETKTVLEAGKRRHAVRVICRLRTKWVLSDQLAQVIADKIYQTCRTTRGLKEVEVLANPGHDSHHAEFVLIGELDDFHRYGGILHEIEQLITGLAPDSLDEFRSLFEMDAVSLQESHDGRLLHELYRHRARRGR